MRYGLDIQITETIHVPRAAFGVFPRIRPAGKERHIFTRVFLFSLFLYIYYLTSATISRRVDGECYSLFRNHLARTWIDRGESEARGKVFKKKIAVLGKLGNREDNWIRGKPWQ